MTNIKKTLLSFEGQKYLVESVVKHIYDQNGQIQRIEYVVKDPRITLIVKRAYASQSKKDANLADDANLLTVARFIEENWGPNFLKRARYFRPDQYELHEHRDLRAIEARMYGTLYRAPNAKTSNKAWRMQDLNDVDFALSVVPLLKPGAKYQIPAKEVGALRRQIARNLLTGDGPVLIASNDAAVKRGSSSLTYDL